MLVGHGLTLLAGSNIKARDTVEKSKNNGEIVRYVICVPIMRVPMYIQNTCHAYLAMKAVCQEIKKHNKFGENTLPPIVSVSIPALCAGGFSMMPHSRLAKQMKVAYEQCVLEKREGLALARDLDELVTTHVRMSEFKVGDKV